ncbi:MAG TPA: hypothetical protein VGR71_11980, partial [Nitrospira sp.]|nr:hypothetical protein [Nitrospira sp.]
MGSNLLRQAGLQADAVVHYAYQFAHEYDREYGSAGYGRSFLPEDEFRRILIDKAKNSIPNCTSDDALAVAIATEKILATMGITWQKVATNNLLFPTWEQVLDKSTDRSNEFNLGDFEPEDDKPYRDATTFYSKLRFPLIVYRVVYASNLKGIRTTNAGLSWSVSPDAAHITTRDMYENTKEFKD